MKFNFSPVVAENTSAAIGLKKLFEWMFFDKVGLKVKTVGYLKGKLYLSITNMSKPGLSPIFLDFSKEVIHMLVLYLHCGGATKLEFEEITSVDDVDALIFDAVKELQENGYPLVTQLVDYCPKGYRTIIYRGSKGVFLFGLKETSEVQQWMEEHNLWEDRERELPTDKKIVMT